MEPAELKSSQIQVLLNRREYSQADILITDLTTQQPRNPDGPYFKGMLLYFQGAVGQAVTHLKKALSLNPGHTDAAVCLSIIYNDIGKYDEAKRFFEQANQSVASRQSDVDYQIDRKFAVKHLELADLYYRYRRYDEAIDQYTSALQLDPSAHEIKIRRVKALVKKGFFSRSMQELAALKKEKPTYLPGRIQLGLLHYNQGNFLDAELEWEEVLKLDPENREACVYLSRLRQAN